MGNLQFWLPKNMIFYFFFLKRFKFLDVHHKASKYASFEVFGVDFWVFAPIQPLRLHLKIFYFCISIQKDHIKVSF